MAKFNEQKHFTRRHLTDTQAFEEQIKDCFIPKTLVNYQFVMESDKGNVYVVTNTFGDKNLALDDNTKIKRIGLQTLVNLLSCEPKITLQIPNTLHKFLG